MLTWGLGFESGFDLGFCGVALIEALAPNKGVDLGLWVLTCGFVFGLEFES